MLRQYSIALALVICLVFKADFAYAQFSDRCIEAPSALHTNPSIRGFQFWNATSSGNDDRDISYTDAEQPVISSSRKSPFLAAGLSFILPGLGEYYVGDQIWRGLIFTAIEGGMWYGRLTYIGRGDDSLFAFHAFADSLWSPAKYSDSLNALLMLYGRDYRIPTTDPIDFSKINIAEDSLDYLNVINFTHRLPSRGSQQYYELISKYNQFAWGWRDGNSQSAKDSPEAERHSQMRANMNEQYQNADYFLWGMLVNRILSALDAVLLAKDHNSAIRLEGELQRRPMPDGQMGYVPTAKLRWTF